MSIETAKPLADVVEGVKALFAEKFGAAPQCVTAAPGRVNLIGEHTDYNDGFVLPMAIDRQTVVAASKRDDDRPVVRLYSATMKGAAELTIEPDGAELPGWAKYVRGVIDAYREAGVDVPAFDAVIDSTVPLGGGLSSSAALEVSLALVIETLNGKSLPGPQRALLCQQAEHQGAGVPCGIMDQFSSALCHADHVMLLDCRSQQPKMVPFTDPTVSVLITNSNVKHELTGGEYAERRQQCEAAAAGLGVKALRDVTPEQLAANEAKLDPLPFKRARHITGENLRTERAAEALAASDWETAGELMYASHAAMRDDFEITVPEIDKLVEIAREIGPEEGVIGSRMTGGGFGGCTVTLVRTDKAEEVARTIAERYKAATGIEATCFTTRPAEGGRVLES
ncbi:Galactokinase [Botrimarina colliarenosi]|uniref:Galactokinase n=1 Tax=Botrimarina colliarenosi TaxID=2528001 RepID=A0A5C6AFR1_9BACT|nr:galactokinase [Botrimarina colliarenosi]TWT98148.1 Galactokinase [Botrimarina colliarenosi]